MSKAAPRYAKALLDALTASGELERTLPLLRGLAALPEQDASLLGNPTIPVAKRIEALRQERTQVFLQDANRFL